MCWLNETATGSFETGALQLDFESRIWSGSGSVKAPLARWPAGAAVSAASPALEMTFAVVCVVYVRSTPGAKAPKVGTEPRVSESVGGTVPLTGALALVCGAVTTIVVALAVGRLPVL